MIDATPSATPMPAQPLATATNPAAPFPPADSLPVFVPPSVMDPVSNLDFLPVVDAFTLEMRSETIEQLVGGDSLRRGESERIEAGRSGANADLVAGRDHVRVHGSLHEHTGHGLTEQAAHLHTTVDGTLDVHAASEDTVLLAGHMRDRWDGGAAIVAAMTDDTVGGGGIRVTTPLDLWVHGLMGVEERIGTCTADAVLLELGATHYEREYGPGVHAAGLAAYTGSLYQSSRSTFRPLMRASSGVRNLIAGGGGGGGGGGGDAGGDGDAGAGSTPGASPPPVPTHTDAAVQTITGTLAAGRRAAQTPAAALDTADTLTDARRVPLDELVDSVDARAGEEMGEAGTVMRAQDLPELSRCADTADRLGALRETLRIDATEPANEATGGFRGSELEGAVSMHPAIGGGGALDALSTQVIQPPPATGTPPAPVPPTTMPPIARLHLCDPPHPIVAQLDPAFPGPAGRLVHTTDIPGPPPASSLPGPSVSEATGAESGGLGRGWLDPPATDSGATPAHPAASETIVTPTLAGTSPFWLQPVDPVPAPGTVQFDPRLHHAGETAQPSGPGRGRLDPPAPASGATAAHPAATETIVTPTLAGTSSSWLQPFEPVPTPGPVPFDAGPHHAGQTAQPSGLGRGRLDPLATASGATPASSTAPAPGAPLHVPSPVDNEFNVERALLAGRLPTGFNARQLISEASMFEQFGIAEELAAGRLPTQNIDRLIEGLRAADPGSRNVQYIAFLGSLKESIERALRAAYPERADPQRLEYVRKLLRQRGDHVPPHAASATVPGDFEVAEIARAPGTGEGASYPAPLPPPEAPGRAGAGAGPGFDRAEIIRRYKRGAELVRRFEWRHELSDAKLAEAPGRAGAGAGPGFDRAAVGADSPGFARRVEIVRRYKWGHEFNDAEHALLVGRDRMFGWSNERWRRVLTDLKELNAVSRFNISAAAEIPGIDWHGIEEVIRILDDQEEMIRVLDDQLATSPGNDFYPHG